MQTSAYGMVPDEGLWSKAEPIHSSGECQVRAFINIIERAVQCLQLHGLCRQTHYTLGIMRLHLLMWVQTTDYYVGQIERCQSQVLKVKTLHKFDPTSFASAVYNYCVPANQNSTSYVRHLSAYLQTTWAHNFSTRDCVLSRCPWPAGATLSSWFPDRKRSIFLVRITNQLSGS